MADGGKFKLFLAGGGSAQEEAHIWRAASEGCARMLYLPLASTPDDKLGAETWLTQSFNELGIRIHIDTWLTLAGRNPEELEQYDMLFVGGGFMSNLAREVNDHGFADPLRQFIHSGRTYFGDSAGALLVCEDVGSAADLDEDPDARGMSGLGVLKGMSVLPHSDVFPSGSADKIATEYGVPVLAIPEGTGVFANGRDIFAMGSRPVELVEDDGTRVRLPEL